MILSQLQKDVEQVQACLAKGNLDEAETMLELVLMDIKNAQQSVQSTKAIRCACGGEMLANYRCQNCGLASPL